LSKRYLKCYLTHLSEYIVKNLNMSLSLTLNKNAKVYIRNKTYKPTALTFCIKDSIIVLYMFNPYLLLNIPITRPNNIINTTYITT